MDEVEVKHISHQSIMIYYYNPKIPKQHRLKELMELKLGNLSAQAFTDKFNELEINLVKGQCLPGRTSFLSFIFVI